MKMTTERINTRPRGASIGLFKKFLKNFAGKMSGSDDPA